MKKIILSILFLSTLGIYAQSSEQDDIDIVQAVYGKEKTELVSKYMALPADQVEAFSKVYAEYEAERKALGRQKIQIIKEYAASYVNMNEESADKIAKEALNNNMAYDKLQSKYYGKVKKEIGAVNALKFMQLENYLQTIIRLELQTEIPFIGELDSKK
jgi:hypothetical protein